MKYKAESSEMPVEIDTNSSSVYNYIRENIKKSHYERVNEYAD